MSEWILLAAVTTCIGLTVWATLYLSEPQRPRLSSEERRARDIQRVKKEVARWSRGMNL